MADPATIRALAGRCRALAAGTDDRTAADFRMLAEAYEEDARRADATANPPPQPRGTD